MSSSKDVIVVGAGIVGASIAWHLARAGASVTLIAPEVGGVATRDSFAWLNATWRMPRAYYDFRRRSMAAWRRLADDVPALHEIVAWRGALRWDMADEELARYATEHAAWGYDIRRIERDEMQDREPSLAHKVLPDWGLCIAEEGAVEASKAAALLVADAQTRGATLISTTVSALKQEDGAVNGVVLENGDTMYARHIVLAAGLGSVKLCESVGVHLPVTGKEGLLVHSKPLAKRLVHGLVLAPKLHMRQTAEGRLVAGSGYTGSDAGIDPKKTAADLFAKVKGMFNLEGTDQDELQLDFFTVGTRPTPADGLPILGPAGIEGLSLAVMHSGVTLAPIVGELLADGIVNGKKDSAFQGFGLDRFTSSMG